jgi:hypothetical protein
VLSSFPVLSLVSDCRGSEGVFPSYARNQWGNRQRISPWSQCTFCVQRNVRHCVSDIQYGTDNGVVAIITRAPGPDITSKEYSEPDRAGFTDYNLAGGVLRENGDLGMYTPHILQTAGEERGGGDISSS